MSTLDRRRGRLVTWASDLALGIRLAVGGGRTSRTAIARLLLGTVGVAAAVTVLLFAASANHAISERGSRQVATIADDLPIAGVTPLTMLETDTRFRSEDISIRYVYAHGPTAPVPPGLDRVPGPGQTVLSPALAELLRSDRATLLRPRFAGPVAGIIGQAGLANPHDLRAYIGADASLQGEQAYSFGVPATSDNLDPGLLALLLIGIISLLAPVFVFVATSARIAGAERDRRLAALRLVGADLPQVRRIATAESLVTSATGLVLGAVAFVFLRQLVPSVRVRDGSLFVSDVTPPWPLVVLIVAVVPALSVMSSLLALHGTAIEPLGVVRRAKPIRRVLWWRLVPIVTGVALLLTLSLRGDSRLSTIFVGVGVACLLIGVPALLPWLLEHAVARMHGGRPAFQLAVRRLQLDSGTPARVVAGLAVVLAGAIAVQSLLAGQAQSLDPGPLPQKNDTHLAVDTDATAAGAAATALANVPGVSTLHLTRSVSLRGKNPDDEITVEIADCSTWLAYGQVQKCRDGAVYVNPTAARAIHSGQSFAVTEFADNEHTIGSWTVPKLTPMPPSAAETEDRGYTAVLATPAAVAGLDLSHVRASGSVQVTSNDPDLPEVARNALAPLGWHVSLFVRDPVRLTDGQRSYLAIRAGLLAGSVFTMLLAGVSLLVLSLEQLRERRHTIAMLSATGVPLRVLARSVVWQNGIPLLLGVVTAVVNGIGLSALGAHLTRASFTVDWLAVGVLSATAAGLVLLITTVTLPSLRGAAQRVSVRME